MGCFSLRSLLLAAFVISNCITWTASRHHFTHNPVGCDMMLGSNAREDKCRECRGNGTNCHTASGRIDTQDLRKGYNDILLIPMGATSIYIGEIKESNNYLALRSKQDNVYYLNGDYKIDLPRTLMIAGAPWHYERSQQGFAAPDKLRCLGPTTEPLYLSLLLLDENVGIDYEYSIPTTLVPPPNQQYVWVHDEFTPCTATCGGGYQTRTVTCRSREDLDEVDESLCDSGLKPSTNDTCNLQACAATWVQGPWGACSKPCGEGGSRSRQVYCQKIISNGVTFSYSSIVEDQQCFELLGPKPELYQECNKNASCPTWFTGPWKPCDKLCGEGKQTRQVVCHQKNNGRVEVLADSQCADEMPPAEQGCMLHPCDGVDWVLSDWTGCDNCLSRVKSRVAECATKDKTVVDPKFCANHHPTPQLERLCNKIELPPCQVQWYATQWSNCSVECGTRRVFCGLFDGESCLKVADSMCENETKYNTTTPCETPKEESPAKWFAGPWSECTKPCGGGEQYRKVMCLSGGKEATSCDGDAVLDASQACNSGPCDADGLLPDDAMFTPVLDDKDYEDCEDEERDGHEVGAEDLMLPEGAKPPPGFTMFSDAPYSTGYTELESEFTAETGSGTGTGSITEGSSTVTEETSESGGTTTWDWASTVSIYTKKPRCRPRKRPAKCFKTTFGCCPDKTTPAAGPFDEGCLNPTTCKETILGCCPDGVSPVHGPHNRGCPSPKCNEALYGCCKSDNSTPAEGNDQEGCPPPPCKSSKFGCCKDGKTEATGPRKKGCPETATEAPKPSKGKGCEASKFGCCHDNKTEAAGPDGQGCSPCNATEFGCCPDGVTPAGSAQMEGCVKSCNTSAHGCCPDGETPAHGPDYEGCCLLYRFGCCPDNYKPADGPHLEGCGCQYARFGCCPDNVTIAHGNNKEGCGCQYAEHGCCPDKHTEATGANFEGCGCHTYQFGCCPDGVTVAKGPNLQGCDCRQSTHGCCGDGITAAAGPDLAGCDCASSKYGCCPDGQTEAKGEKFDGCTDKPENKQAACSLPYEHGPCYNYTAYWFFDMQYGGCAQFWYGGCDGNGNRFATKDECKDVCVRPPAKEVCALPKVAGGCRDSYPRPRWYYDATYEQCGQFEFSGCLGNANNFETRELCQAQCQPDRNRDQCKLPIERGPCAGNFNRWGFNRKEGRCEQFAWGGCGGNGNRFSSEAACMLRCQPPGALQHPVDRAAGIAGDPTADVVTPRQETARPTAATLTLPPIVNFYDAPVYSDPVDRAAGIAGDPTADVVTPRQETARPTAATLTLPPIVNFYDAPVYSDPVDRAAGIAGDPTADVVTPRQETARPTAATLTLPPIVNFYDAPVYSGLYVPPQCTDNPFFSNCQLIVNSKFCNHKYYSSFCCKSCVEAGFLNPQELQADQSWMKKK